MVAGVKVFAVEVDMLKVEPLFVLGCTYDELCAYMLKRFKVRLDPEDGENRLAGRMFTFDCPPWRMVWTRRLDLPVVLHETFHLTTRICADKGITVRSHNEHGQNDDETAAYLFEALARPVLKRLAKVKQ